MLLRELSDADVRDITGIIAGRARHLEGRIHRLEVKELHAPSPARQKQIGRFATEVGDLLDLVDRIEGGAA